MRNKLTSTPKLRLEAVLKLSQRLTPLDGTLRRAADYERCGADGALARRLLHCRRLALGCCLGGRGERLLHRVGDTRLLLLRRRQARERGKQGLEQASIPQPRQRRGSLGPPQNALLRRAFFDLTAGLE